ncbi:RNA polymerase sigma-70 factor [Prolixibacteraceae bacterium Z1-6]|uniref:RNA polymerase sigma factor n=1 Tax=Draconibacterium aestuarii TaxID=2998507 RepID=A0A9X3J7B0_9BACT|nr:RNA polymerase sigma-70 factor [Prolixibacteraceae bacterium Z1-6]
MSDKQSHNDIIVRLKNNEIKAFDDIYHKYCNRLYGFVLKLIKQESDAEEIVQEVFVKIWASRQKIDENASFESFLFTIAYNNTISLLRKRVNEKKYLDYLQNLQIEIKSDTIIDDLHFKDLDNQYRELINQLTPRQKEIYLLSRENGLTYKEIAEKLDISSNTVEIHISKAIQFIKSRIGKAMLVNVLFIDLFIS